MADAVLNGSAILALILEKPGAGRLQPYVLDGAASGSI